MKILFFQIFYKIKNCNTTKFNPKRQIEKVVELKEEEVKEILNDKKA